MQRILTQIFLLRHGAVAALAAIVFFTDLFQERPRWMKLHFECLRPGPRENLRVVDCNFVRNSRRVDVLEPFDRVQGVTVPAVPPHANANSPAMTSDTRTLDLAIDMFPFS